ncbi:MAG: aldehyde dehydrogenase [Firmicutes bacterium]|nr:aldehyde dehydrogenase [Bacillota bacterium]
MEKERIHEIVEKQRAFFNTGKTLDVSYRMAALKKLNKAVNKHEDRLAAALKADLGKSFTESYMCEIGITYSEITYMRRWARWFARDKYVLTPLAQFHATSFVKPMPHGVTLIMSPWNYPVLLTLEPLVDALAAGNTAIVKPSAYSPYTSDVLKELIEETFDPEYVAVVTGGREENTYLLDEKFDHVFFTGSKEVGRTVMAKASKHLCPVTLELGGKSPCIVGKTADIPLAAKRIVFGKLLNCGQTCVAPDYVLCHPEVKQELIEGLIAEIKTQYGENYLENEDYGKIVTKKHFDRINRLIDAGKTVYGGGSNEATLQIEPTIMDGVTWNDPVMQEEIFGPVLPILEYKNRKDVIDTINSRPRPLALYVFTDEKEFAKEITTRCAFGGGCINDTIIHLATSNMGFGGNGESGMGAYHGKVGFDEFSSRKSIVDKKTWLDLPMRYQPYNPVNEKLLKMFLR